ncbi:MAG TPA: coenzyme F420-reducing hydrogenase, FrhD protein [Deltaproteobacteria bacterium]|jgi:coenzyme F420 hydrogenase subunit delta|nr:MAG: hydrogenase 2 maturation endopeptidase [Methanoregulaceae archaeon PtaB.Bin009]HNQ30039.1 coenzyme F420-reducing hydrogenase, FrhD protein [Methanolinea sp.]HNS91296.1 coenzyme F420-reducing hydrogenase, FrhD protein [Deltaproteobacteria bacterium]
MLYPEIVIAGCGNPLFADDGFGPAVVEELLRLDLPDNIKAVDAGLGGPHFIFTLLDTEVTRKLIIVDTVDFGGNPGELVRLKVEDLPPGSYRDAHSWDLTEPLHRLKDSMEIAVIGCQPKHVSAPEFEMGLSDEVSGAIPRAVREVLALIGVDYGTTLENLRKEERQPEAGGEACGES